MKLCRENVRRMAGYVPGEQPKDRRYIKLNTNENPYPPSPRVLLAFRDFDPKQLRLYPDPLAGELRRIAGEQAGLDADWVLCGNGSDDLLTIAVRTFVDQGGALAHLDPSYSLYPVLAELQGARSVAIPLSDNFELSRQTMPMAVGCSLFFIARPNAPTGNAFPLADMHDICRTFSGVVWIDEAYVDFCPDHCLEFVKQYPNVVVSRTVSKSYSLAGLRLGFAYARPELIREMMKVKDSYNINILTQILGKAALEDQEYVRQNAVRICRTRDRLSTALQKVGCRVLPSAANFLFVKPPRSAEWVFRELRRCGILVRYFSVSGIDEYLRITIGTEEEIDELLEVFGKIIDSR